MAKLPARSVSRQIQPYHIRRYASGKAVIINPDVDKKVQRINKIMGGISRPGQGREISPKPPTPIRAPKPVLLPAIRLRWQDVLKPDTGEAVPLGSQKVSTSFEKLKGMMYNYPEKNEDDFFEMLESNFKDDIEALNQDWISHKIKTKEEFEKKEEELAESMSAYLDDDLNEPEATIEYGDEYDELSDHGNMGYIGAYTMINADGIDTAWVGQGWRGYYDVVLPKDSPWEILHEDNVLGMSADSGNLKKFDELLQAELRERGIKFARVIARSSNIFSSGYTFLVEKGRGAEVKGLVKQLTKAYRKPEDYEAEVNPLVSGVKAAKNRGLSNKEIKKLTKSFMSSEVRDMLEEAMRKVK